MQRQAAAHQHVNKQNSMNSSESFGMMGSSGLASGLMNHGSNTMNQSNQMRGDSGEHVLELKLTIGALPDSPFSPVASNVLEAQLARVQSGV